MISNFTGDKPPPSRLGISLIKKVLPSQVAHTLIGDLQEEYYLRLGEQDFKIAQLWFWTQVISTVANRVRELRPDRTLMHKASDWCRPRTGHLVVLSEWSQRGRLTATAHFALSVVFICFMVLLSPHLIYVGEESSPSTDERAANPSAKQSDSSTESMNNVATAYSLRGRTASGRL